MEKILLLGGSGLVGKAVTEALGANYLVIPAAGHHIPEGGYCLPIEDTELLTETLERENPDTVISSLRGDFGKQMKFHRALADWLKAKNKGLIFISTANVFDGDLSCPHTEADVPIPESEYGIFKRDCENMLFGILGGSLTVFRPASVWDKDCPRILSLKKDALSKTPHPTYSGDQVNITYAKQIGAYAKFVLENNLNGIFHIGTTDTVDYFEFEKMICKALGIALPDFEVTKAETQAYQAVLPSRKEIPDSLQMTVDEVLKALTL